VKSAVSSDITEPDVSSSPGTDNKGASLCDHEVPQPPDPDPPADEALPELMAEPEFSLAKCNQQW
jgi:hypothetical protein